VRINFKEINNHDVLLLTDVPCELETSIWNWIDSLGDDFSADFFFFKNSVPYAFTRPGWESLVAWMCRDLMGALVQPEFRKRMRESLVA